MPKNLSVVADICDKISRYLVYAAVAITPILFLPWTSDALDFNKQNVFIIFAFLALFAFMIKVMILGNLKITQSKLHFVVLFFFLVYLFSTIFSLDKFSSFWGWPRSTAESLLSLSAFLVVYVLITNLFSKKDILNSLVIFFVSSLVSILYGALQLLGLYVLPFKLVQNPSFNTIGIVSSLGFFAAILLPFLIIASAKGKLWQRIAAFVSVVLCLVLFVLINYSSVWLIVLVGTAITVFIIAFRKEVFDLRWISVPMFFLVLSLFFLSLQPQISVKQRAIEVFLNHSSSFDITINTLKENPVLGSGPATFIYDFSKYRNADFNQGSLWNLRFGSASSKFLTLLATTGLLGLASFIILILTIIISAIKFLFSPSFDQERKSDDYLWSILVAGLFVAFTTETIGFLLLGSNFTLEFSYFFFIACLVGLISQNKKGYSLSSSAFFTLGTTFLFTLLFIFGLGILFLSGQRYIAEVNYYSGLAAYAAGDSEKALNKFETAANFNPNNDVYLTELSQIYLSKIEAEISRKDISDDEKTQNIERLVNNSINAAKMATDINPNNVSNWSVRGFIYQNLIGIGVDGMTDWAIKCYDQAIKLEPTNPYYATQEGVSYLNQAAVFANANKTKEENDSLENAKAKIEEAIKLKSDYASARYQLAVVYAAQGKIDEEFAALEETKKYSPNDIGLAFQIGVLYYQKKDYQNAKSEFERAVSLNSTYANALYFLSMTYYKLGQNEKAIQAMQKVLDLNPDNTDVKTALENLKAGKAPVASLSDQAPIEEAATDTNPEPKK